MNNDPVNSMLTQQGATPGAAQVGGAVNSTMMRPRMNPRMGQPGPGMGRMDPTDMLGGKTGRGKRMPGGPGGGNKMPDGPWRRMPGKEMPGGPGTIPPDMRWPGPVPPKPPEGPPRPVPPGGGGWPMPPRDFPPYDGEIPRPIPGPIPGPIRDWAPDPNEPRLHTMGPFGRGQG